MYRLHHKCVSISCVSGRFAWLSQRAHTFLCAGCHSHTTTRPRPARLRGARVVTVAVARDARRGDGRLGYSRAAREYRRTRLVLDEGHTGSGDDTATFVYPSCDIRRAHLFLGARSSAGQSSCLLSSGSRVRILPGALGQPLMRTSAGAEGAKKGSQSEYRGSHDAGFFEQVSRLPEVGLVSLNLV